jgi:hypothetical protein
MRKTPWRWLLASCPIAWMLWIGQASAQQTYPTTAPSNDAGFESIFDGKSLAGWDGDPKFWRVQDGALVGEITPGNEIKRNTFVVWRGGLTKDFELKLRFRISAKGNSGINYRSEELADAPFSMAGYQFDLDGANRYTANNYEERGRTFMALRGQITRAVDGGKREVIAAVGDYKDLARFIKNDDWNEVHIIARGNTLVHILNGHVMSILIDDDAVHRAAEGKLGVQVHVGPPMKVEYRDIRLRKL